MARKLPSIPKPTSQIPKAIADVLNPIRDIIESRFLGKTTTERVITGDDLIKLGLVSADDINQLDN